MTGATLTEGGATVRSTTYTYDPVGSRLTCVRGTTTTYQYDRADRIFSVGGTGYVVNANGNLTARSADTFAYDQANRLKQSIVGSTTANYTWDGDGKRATSTVGPTATPWTYDTNRGLPVVLNDGTRKYVWGLGLAYAVQGTTVDVYHAHRPVCRCVPTPLTPESPPSAYARGFLGGPGFILSGRLATLTQRHEA